MMMNSSSSSSNNHNENLSTKLTNLSAADLNKRDCFGNTILHLICKTGKNERLKNLLKNKNLNLSTTDLENGWNCLHLTIFHKNLVMTNLLIQHASATHKLELLLKQKDREGLTPMDLFSSEIEFDRLKARPIRLGGLKLPHNQISKYSIKEIQVDSRKYSFESTHKEAAFQVNAVMEDGPNEVIIYSEDKCNFVDLGYEDNESYFTHAQSTVLSENFKKRCILSVHMSTKHSIIVTAGVLFVSGFGSKGRLGLGNLKNYTNEFVPLPMPFKSIDVAVAENHTLIVTDEGLFAFGSNEFGCLGRDYRITEELSPVPVYSKGMNSIKKVSCSKIHSTCYSDHSVWMWGLNIGQMGKFNSNEVVVYNNQKGSIIREPQELKFSKVVKQVVCNEFATLILVDSSDLHLYMNGFHVKLSAPLYKGSFGNIYMFKPRILTTSLNLIKLVYRNNCVLLIYDDGRVVKMTLNPKWTNSSEVQKDLKFTQVWGAKRSHLKCISADIGDDGSIVLCVKDGSVYKGAKRQYQKKKALFKFSRLSNVSDIKYVVTDPDFKKFMFIRELVPRLPFQFNKHNFYIDMERLSLLGPDERTTFSKTINLSKQQNGRDSKKTSIGHDLWNYFSEDDTGTLCSSDSIKYLKTEGEHQKFFKKKTDTMEFQERLLSTEWLERKCSEYPPTSHYIKSSEDDLIIPIHKPLLYHYGVFKKVFAGEDYIYKDKKMCLVENVIHVTGFSSKSIISVIHFLYTGQIIKMPGDRLEYAELLVFEEIVLFFNFIGEDFRYYKLVDLIDFHDLNDTVIHVKDGYFTSYSFLLQATSSYFEVLLNWKKTDDNLLLEYEVDLTHIDRNVFHLILRYLHGENLMKLFDSSKFEDSSEVINFAFSCIESSDELLLFDLKDFLELVISWFVDVHNVLLILRHSFELNCNKLFEYCLWVIYNDLPLLIFDEEFESVVNENNFDLLKRMDYGFKFFHGLKTGINYKIDNWYEKNLDSLIKLFIYEGEKFNLIFNSGTFELVFELVAAKEKKQTRSPSQSSSIPPILVKPKSVSPSPASPEINNNNSAILDDIVEEGDQDWKVFTNRRRSSAARRLSTNNNNNETNNNPIIEPSPSSKARQSSIIEQALEVEDEAIKTKAKIKIPKASQRERKKSTFELTSSVPMSKDASSSSRSVTPAWNINTPAKLKQITPNNSPYSSSLGTPSLSEIMFEQEKLLNPQQKPVKSLQEVQQEEEFERWFNEESRKYQEQQQQQELQLLQQFQNTPPSSKPKNFKKKPKVKTTKTNKNNNNNSNDQTR